MKFTIPLNKAILSRSPQKGLKPAAAARGKKPGGKRQSLWKKVFKGTLVDMLAISICLAGAGAAFYFFWKDLNKSMIKLNEKPIANIHFKKNTAQRRFGDRVVWDVLQKDAPIYNGDVIHTSDLSEATINFVDANGNEGNGFDLSENSMIQVYEGRIELANGKIDIHTIIGGTELRLVSAGTVIEIGANSTVSANSAAAGGGSIQILEGSAKVITVDGVQETSAGEAVSVSADGRRETVAQVVLLSPKPNQTIVMASLGTETGALQAVRFTWRNIDFASEDFVRFEVAQDQRFTKIVQSADVRNAVDQTVRLAAGTYWWRAYPANRAAEQKNGAGLLSNKLSIITAAVPKPLQPADNSVLRYYAETPPPVRFQWSVPGSNAQEQANTGFIVEVADSLSMQNPKVRQEVYSQNFLVVNDLGQGRWYWQVRPVYPENFDGANLVQSASSPSAFSIERSTSGLAAPRLVNPPDASELTIEKGIMLSWQAENEAAAYTIQIAQDSEFSSPLVNQKISANYFNLTAAQMQTYRDGVYYWRVSAADSLGGASPFSSLRSWTLSTAPVPVELVYPKDNWTTSETTLTSSSFSWKVHPSGSNGSLRWQVSDSADFASLLVNQPVSGSELVPPQLNAGSYYWRVLWTEGESAGGKTFAAAPRRFTVQASVRITLEYPADNAELDGITMMRNPPSLRWSSNEPVLRSRLVLSASSNPAADPAPLLDSSNPSWSVPLPALRPGVYYWIVQGETRSGVNIGAARAYSFRVGAVSQLPAVTLTAPQNNYVINANTLKTSRAINFAWSASPSGNGYLFSIYRAADRARANPVFKSPALKQNSFVFNNLALLDNGNFVWTVEPVFTGGAGEVEQHGELREAAFSVNIAIPQSESLPNEEIFGF